MKKILLSLSVILIGSIAMNAQSVSVNTDGSTADASSILDVKSTTKGMLVPRMTTGQRTAITAPANGLLVYDTDVKSFWYYNGTAWTNLMGATGGTGSFTLPFDTTGSFVGSPLSIQNENLSNYSPIVLVRTKAAYAIYGESENGSAVGGLTNSPAYYGTVGRNHSATAGSGAGILGYSDLNVGVKGHSLMGIGVRGSSGVNGVGGVLGESSDSAYGVRGSSFYGIGVHATSEVGNAIKAEAFGTKYTIDAHATQAEAIYANTDAVSKAAIKGEANAAGSMGVFGTSINGYGVRGFSGGATGVNGSTNTGYGIIASANTGVGIRTSSTYGNALEVYGKLKIYGSAVNPQNGSVLTSDAEGNASWKLNRVAFRTSGAGTTPHMGSLLLHNVEQYDYSNSYNTTTGNFTVPVSGVYVLGAQTTFSLTNDINDNIIEAYLQISVIRNGVGTMYSSPYATIRNIADASYATAHANINLKLLAGDIVKVSCVQENTDGATIGWNGVFFGHLVFAE